MASVDTIWHIQVKVCSGGQGGGAADLKSNWSVAYVVLRFDSTKTLLSWTKLTHSISDNQTNHTYLMVWYTVVEATLVRCCKRMNRSTNHHSENSEGCNKCCSYNKADAQGQNCWEINGQAIAAQLNSYRVTRKSTSLVQGLPPRHVDPGPGAGNQRPEGAVWPRCVPQDKPLFFQIIASGCLFFFFSSKTRLPLLCRARNNGFKPQVCWPHHIIPSSKTNWHLT